MSRSFLVNNDIKVLLLEKHLFVVRLAVLPVLSPLDSLRRSDGTLSLFQVRAVRVHELPARGPSGQVSGSEWVSGSE